MNGSLSDHDALVTLMATMSTLVDNVNRLVEAQREMTRALQDHIMQPVHAVEGQILENHSTDIEDLQSRLDTVEETVSDHSGNWKVAGVGGALLLAMTGTLTGIVAKAVFHIG